MNEKKSVAQEIESRLRAVFSPHVLNVVDDSARHQGHAGYQEGGESHFNVQIRAAGFAGLSRLKRHRAVHEALGPELLGRIHALALDLDV